MQVFINETSLHGQYNHSAEFVESLNLFLSTIKRLTEIKNHKSVFRNESFYYSSGMNNLSFDGLFKKNNTLAWTFRENLNRLNLKSWEKQKIHDETSLYEFNKESFTGTSVAEISERKLQITDLKGFLINFIGSKYGDMEIIDVIKNDKESIAIDCVVSPESLENWLIIKGFINPLETYDEKSGIAPTDLQTVLKEDSIFEKTTYPRNNGRIVYRRIGTNELWVVDNALKHAGAKAHIEVFNEVSREHLGTSLYNQINVDNKFIGENRKINLG